ncbi:MAG: hypothetical protein WC299_11960 [Kiritimatiellia bacterium]
MAKLNMHCATAAGRISFGTNTGFSMEHGLCAIQTTRGELRPLPGKKISRGTEVELNVHRLSGSSIEFWQSLRNLHPADLKISAIKMFDGTLRLAGAGWRMAHGELFQKESYFNDYSYFTGGLLAPIPGTEGEFGMSENLPFPGITFTHPERGTVIMGVLSQERCKPVWKISGRGASMHFTAEERFTGVPHILAGEGRELATERWVMLFTPGGLENAIDEYYALLRKRVSFYGADSILRRAVMWGSWNYNLRPRGHMDVTHDVAAANSKALAKLVPDKPRFVMIDDGYQRGSISGSTRGWFASCLEIFHPDGQSPHDPKLFPRGMKAAADAIRKGGSEPAIWTTPRVLRTSSLVADRPELFLKAFDKIGKRTAYLDYSIPEAREYTRSAWNTICNEWGYKGVKLDFWSLPFEIPEVRYRNQDRTAIELRNMFLKDLRDIVQPGGYILTGCVVNAGNPFVGKYVDAVRAGADIGDGSWKLMLQSGMCLTATVPFCRHDCTLADADSIGWNPNVSADENRLWATMAFMSGGVCEIGGDLTRLDPEAKKILGVVTRHFGPARRTLNGVSGAGLINMPASHMLLERDDGVYEAYLNWLWFGREIELSRSARDLWTGEIISGSHRIPAHGAIMFKH